jgi:hypothetical protein
MGVTNAVACLDAQVTPTWRDTLQALRPGMSCLAVYVGYYGDITAASATAANGADRAQSCKGHEPAASI